MLRLLPIRDGLLVAGLLAGLEIREPRGELALHVWRSIALAVDLDLLRAARQRPEALHRLAQRAEVVIGSER
jgi:hypothetical protein